MHWLIIQTEEGQHSLHGYMADYGQARALVDHTNQKGEPVGILKGEVGRGKSGTGYDFWVRSGTTPDLPISGTNRAAYGVLR